MITDMQFKTKTGIKCMDEKFHLFSKTIISHTQISLQTLPLHITFNFLLKKNPHKQ